MVCEIRINRRVLVRQKYPKTREAKEEKARREGLVGNFYNHWEIFTWGSKEKLESYSLDNGIHPLNRIEVNLADISAGVGSREYFNAVGLEQPDHYIRVHSWSTAEVEPVIPISQRSMMGIVKELEKSDILCLLHHNPTANFVGWRNSVDYLSPKLREKMGDNCVNSAFELRSDFDYLLPINF